jgi:tRNA threonylcarbamoyladenosine biosynthesis protein TsaB
MNIMAMDTSTDRAIIALSTADGRVFETVSEGARQHGRDLIPRLSSVLREAGLRALDLEAVAVGLGPGSYTGLRVGVTAAKTLAYASGAGLVGLDSLQAVARNAPPEALFVSVVADAQRGDVYVADLARPAPGTPLVAVGESHIERFAEWLERLVPGVFVIGPALESPRFRDALPSGIEAPDRAGNFPAGGPLLELAREAWQTGTRENPWLLEPRYLRRSSAEEKWDAR